MNTPWQIRRLVDGQWAIDQVWNGSKRRFGIYETEAKAKEMLAILRGAK